MSYEKTIACLAHSRKPPSGRCIAGREHRAGKFGDWVRPVAKLKSITTLDWQKTAQARARVLDPIEDALDEALPRAYSKEIFKAKTGVVFHHVDERHGRAA